MPIKIRENPAFLDSPLYRLQISAFNENRHNLRNSDIDISEGLIPSDYIEIFRGRNAK